MEINFRYVNSEEINADNVAEALAGLDGILVPGGFGERGVEGKVLAVQYARERKIPFFGICLGMQCAVVEYARHIAGYADANSEEFAPQCEHKVIHLMTRWFDHHKNCTITRSAESDRGGTMRLGAYPCVLKSGSLALAAYGQSTISERHRHRYEFNNQYRDSLEATGLIFSGLSPDEGLVEMIELKDHPWFLACQFHPEFKSNPMQPHPLFREFVAAAKHANPARR